MSHRLLPSFVYKDTYERACEYFQGLGFDTSSPDTQAYIRCLYPPPLAHWLTNYCGMGEINPEIQRPLINMLNQEAGIPKLLSGGGGVKPPPEFADKISGTQDLEAPPDCGTATIANPAQEPNSFRPERHFTSEQVNLLVQLPRYTGKTSILTGWLAREAIFRIPHAKVDPYKINEPTLSIGIVSWKEGQAQEILNRIRQLCESDLYKAHFPWAVWANPEQESQSWNKSELLLRNNVLIRAVSVKSLGAGTRFNILLWDDALEVPEYLTAQEQENIERQYSFAQNLLHSGAIQVVAGTIYNRDGLGLKLRQNSDFKKVIRSIEDEDGNSVWESHLSNERLAQLRRSQGKYYFGQMLMAIPESAEDRFQESWIQTCPAAPAGGYVTVCLDVAHAQKAKKENCETAIIVQKHIHDGTNFSRYILDGASGKGWDDGWSPSAIVDKVIQYARLYSANSIVLETVGAQGVYMDLLRQRMSDLGCHFRLIEAKGANRKEDRITASLQPEFAAGRAWIVETWADKEKFIQQLKGFPYGLVDMVDAASFTAFDPQWDNQMLCKSGAALEVRRALSRINAKADELMFA